MPAPTILWLGRDLRLADSPALAAALERGGPLLPVFLPDDEMAGPWAPGPAAAWWLGRSVRALAADLAARGSRLVLRRGRAVEALPALAAEAGAGAVAWSRRIEPARAAVQARVAEALQVRGIEAWPCEGATLLPPERPLTQAGGPYKVFTPYWKALQAEPEPAPPRPAPAHLPPCPEVAGEAPEAWTLGAEAPAGLGDHWTPGEAGARARLETFLGDGLKAYEARRDRVDADGTSRLSPHLAWGELGPRQVWHAARQAAGPAAEPFLRQLAWREFSYHLLHHWPDVPEVSWKPEFRAFPWAEDAAALAAWRAGRTGYPIVDAGMRALAATGWLHNRLRMVAASLLVKHLLVPWQAGAGHFWATLVDADLANNALGWQWVAGSGPDAAPYFRVFNPVRQGGRFDPDGAFVRRWVPELARLPAAHVHAPWQAPAHVLAEAGVRLGESYPRPIVDHAEGRQRALAAFRKVKGG